MKLEYFLCLLLCCCLGSSNPAKAQVGILFEGEYAHYFNNNSTYTLGTGIRYDLNRYITLFNRNAIGLNRHLQFTGHLGLINWLGLQGLYYLQPLNTEDSYVYLGLLFLLIPEGIYIHSNSENKLSAGVSISPLGIEINPFADRRNCVNGTLQLRLELKPAPNFYIGPVIGFRTLYEEKIYGFTAGFSAGIIFND